MTNLIEMLQSQLSDGVIDQLSKQLGGADKQKTTTAAEGALSTIISALAKNASTPEGASGLANALEKDHDGSVLNDLMGMVAGASQTDPTPSSRATDGAGILKHILGGKQSNAMDMLSKVSGLSSGQSGNLMSMLAPMVMGMLGKQKKQNNLGLDGLSSLLNGTVQKQKANNNPMMDLATRFLDKDGDGSIMDEAAGFGMKILGGLFKK